MFQNKVFSNIFCEGPAIQLKKKKVILVLKSKNRKVLNQK